jgi:hypothetical protein
VHLIKEKFGDSENLSYLCVIKLEMEIVNNKLSIEDKIILSFEYFTSGITGHKDYELKLKRLEKVLVKNFSKFIINKYGEGSLGTRWFFNYFTFQFEYWRVKITRLGKSGRADISWIIGTKAFQRWENKPDWYLSFCSDGILHFHKDINYGTFKRLLGELPEGLNYQKIIYIEEVERGRFFNKEIGFVHCIQNTSLYQKESKYCSKCNNSKPCEELLKVNYPNIYKVRDVEI